MASIVVALFALFVLVGRPMPYDMDSLFHLQEEPPMDLPFAFREVNLHEDEVTTICDRFWSNGEVSSCPYSAAGGISIREFRDCFFVLRGTSASTLEILSHGLQVSKKSGRVFNKDACKWSFHGFIPFSQDELNQLLPTGCSLGEVVNIIGSPVNLIYQEDSSLLLEYDSRDGIVSVLLHGGHLKSIAINSEEYWVMR